ncbi:hypothetical protein FQN60_018360 [Etheostoma spectabile]|uniref:Uncharacterized protein n=1 Tax=Etheostoma spectabile TaxID=54343 RepID=A0A5J5DHS6_9PERO|nr:hypothetical protein FQN60_018360 [Etheostoma spectabile]
MRKRRGWGVNTEEERFPVCFQRGRQKKLAVQVSRHCRSGVVAGREQHDERQAFGNSGMVGGKGGLLVFLFGKLVKAAQGCKGRAQSHLIPCHHPPLPQCYRSVDVCPCPPEPQSHSPLPHPSSPNTHPPTPNPSTSLPRSLIQCAECQRLPLPTFSPRLAAVIDGNGLRQINPFLVKIAPNNPPRPLACTPLTSTPGSGGGGVSGSVRFILILHLYHSIWLSFHTTVPPYPVLRQKRPSSPSNKAISLLNMDMFPMSPWLLKCENQPVTGAPQPLQTTPKWFRIQPEKSPKRNYAFQLPAKAETWSKVRINKTVTHDLLPKAMELGVPDSRRKNPLVSPDHEASCVEPAWSPGIADKVSEASFSFGKFKEQLQLGERRSVSEGEMKGFLHCAHVHTGMPWHMFEISVWHCAADYRRSLNQVVQSAQGPWGRECATSCQTAQRNNQSSERLQDRGEREGREIGAMEEEKERT